MSDNKQSRADTGIRVPDSPPIINIMGEGGRILLAIHPDGAVEGRVEDASEAARVFMRELRGDLIERLMRDAKAEQRETDAQIAESVTAIVDDPVMEQLGRNAGMVIAAAIRAATPKEDDR